jgi:hypothetical protein
MLTIWKGDDDSADETAGSPFSKALPPSRSSSRLLERQQSSRAATPLARSPTIGTLRTSLGAARAQSYGTASTRAPLGTAIYSRLKPYSLFDDGDDYSASLVDEPRNQPFPHKDIERDVVERTRSGVRCFCCGRVSLRTCVLISLAAVVGVAVIATLLTLKVFAPVYVQSRIAATTLVFRSLNITSPVSVAHGGGAALGAEGFTITVAAELSGLSPVSGTLLPFPTTLSFAGSDVASFTMPRIVAQANTVNAITISAPVSIISDAAFTSFSEALVLASKLDVTLTGTVSVSTVFGGVTLTIDDVSFTKTTGLLGAAGLAGATVSSFSMLDSTPTQAVAEITVAVNNPSSVRIDPLGDFAVRIFYRGLDLGVAYSRGAVLASGANSLRFSGVLPPPAAENASIVSDLISSYLGGRPANLSAKTQSCAAPACPGAVPLFATLFDSGVIDLSATLAPAVTPLISGVVVDSMYLVPMGQKDVGILLNITVLVSGLLGRNSTIFLDSFALNCTLLANEIPLGELSVPLTVLGHRPATVLPESRALATSEAARGASPPTLSALLTIPAVLDISQAPAIFADFVVDFIESPNVTFRLFSRGEGTSRVFVGIGSTLGNLSVSVPFNTSTLITGINSFPGVRVAAFTVLNATAAMSAGVPTDSLAAVITVELINPSIATIPLGANATLGVFAGGTRVGEAIIFNKTLVPGSNMVTTVGVIKPTNDAGFAALSTLFSSYLGGVESTLEVRGEDVNLAPASCAGGALTPECPETPTWLVRAVKSLSLAASLPGLAPELASSLLRNTTLSRLNIDLYDNTTGSFYATPVASGNVSAVLCLPFTLAVSDFGSVNVSFALVELESDETIASLNVSFAGASYVPCTDVSACSEIQSRGMASEASRPLLAAQAELNRERFEAHSAANAVCDASSDTPLYPSGVLFLSLQPTPLAIASASSFSRLVGNVLRLDKLSVRVRGVASPNSVGLPFGDVRLRDLRLDTVVAIMGMANFTNPPVVISSGDITGTQTNALDVIIAVDVTNPSSLTGSFGPASFGVSYKRPANGFDTLYGRPWITIALPNLLVGPGKNNLTAPGVFAKPSSVTSPVAFSLSNELLARFLSQVDSNCALTTFDASDGGPGNSSSSQLLQPALVGFSAKAAFPGLPEPLLKSALIYPGADLAAPTINATIVLKNVLAVNLTLTQAALTM